MFDPVNIVTLGEIRPIMGATAFLPGEGADHNGLCDIEKALEFEGLYEVCIKHQSFVLNRDGSGTMGQCREGRERNRHRFMSPNKAKVETHELAEFFSNLPGSNRSLFCQDTLDATLFGRKLICREGLRRNGSSVLSRSNSSPPAEHNCLKE